MIIIADFNSLTMSIKLTLVKNSVSLNYFYCLNINTKIFVCDFKITYLVYLILTVFKIDMYQVVKIVKGISVDSK